MGKKQNLFDRVSNNPHNVPFREIENLLLEFGFELKRVTGDHYIYKRHGLRPIPVPYKSPVKYYVVKEVLAAIQEIIDQEFNE